MLMTASLVAGLQGGSLALGFCTALVLAHVLTGDAYGSYVYALALTNLLAIPAILGLDRFLVKGMAVYEVREEWPLMKGLLRRTNQLVLAASLISAGGGCLAALAIVRGDLRWAICVALALVPLTTLTLLRQAAMQALNHVVKGQLPEYLVRPLLILGSVTLLAVARRSSLTAVTALAINVGSVAVAFGIGAIMLHRALPAALRDVRPKYDTRSWIRASLPMMLVSGVWLANNYVATLVVGTVDGPGAAGVYNVVEKGAQLIVLVLLAANMPLAPAIARMHARDDREGLERTTERVAQATLAASIPLAAAFAVFPRAYLHLFGGHFETGATALTILALAQLVNAAAGPAGNVLIMTGHEKAAVRGVGAGMVANLVLAIILVPELAVTGAAIASASSLVIWNSVMVVMARRRVGVNVTAFRRLRVAGKHTS